MKALKYSRQREALIHILKNTTAHPSAEVLYVELKKTFPSISLSTVYRNLNLLLENGEIIKLDVTSGTEHYDANVCNHYHFVCKVCGVIEDVDMSLLSELDASVEKQLGSEVDNHSLIFYGRCKKCKSN